MTLISITGGTTRADSAPPVPRTTEAQAAPAAQSSPQPATTPVPTSEAVGQAVQSLRELVEPLAQNLQFSIDDDTGRTVVKVVDGSTHEVLRQIPAEEVLQITRALDRFKGLLLKQQA